ncbi:hypothetical protein BLNAU_6067 [Blattamonas nauphoetae]|uniref:Uncharacterized protein n=1 Tax=Blattamonas nauphoetae TaxID=2049346 RepID=A0ABQ9Y5M3_9EUKA|nr:hypothetical protein BLNAU_6067 [Blattamonas nauphoetae]
MSDLLPSLLSLTHVCLSPPSSLLALSVVSLQHADPTLSVPAAHAIGLMCDSCLPCGDVEGVLNGGVVEKVCSWVENSKEVGNVLGLLRVVDKLCVGLKGAVRSAQKQEQEQNEKENPKEKSEKEQGQAGQMEEESRDGWSLESRCQSALNLMENTLLGLCSTRESEEKESSADVEVTEKAEREKRREEEMKMMKEEMDKLKAEMERKEKERENEAKKREEEREKESTRREQEREREAKTREEERRKEHEQKMAALNEQVERYSVFIEAGKEKEIEANRCREEERRKEEMKRLSKTGAAAIEWFPTDLFSVKGSVFKLKTRSDPTLLSAEFGKVVARFTFTFKKFTSRYRIGDFPSAQTEDVKNGEDFTYLKGGAGWCVHPIDQTAFQNGFSYSKKSACAGMREGQRVVLEADGRDGKRTLRLSQDGQTQPTFFSNISVPFRFALRLDPLGGKFFGFGL